MAWEMNGYHMSDVPLPEPHPYSPYYTETERKASSAGHLEWGPIANDQTEHMVDVIRTNWACEILQQEQNEPFFLAVGMYSPHYPNYAPEKFFDLYERDSIQLPIYKEDDLDDLPAHIRIRMLGRYKQHQELEKYGALKDAIQGYLASISFADSMLGRVMESLNSSKYKDNTIIIFWSDQGFHHGEKGHWGKKTLWQRTSHVPFIWAGKGIASNEEVESTVSLIDMFPTLAALCHLETGRPLEGVSLAPSLRNPSGTKDRHVLLPYSEQNAYSIINKDWRYIHYSDGTEELYNVQEDPHEWENLAAKENYRPIITELQSFAPSEFAPPATERNTLNLVVEGDKFHWEKKSR
jgi:arylsulfatase A-like enzyme